jgi:hypothetical protein
MIRDMPYPNTHRWLSIAVVAFVAGLIMSYLGWRQAGETWIASYLVAWLYWTGISLGSLSLVLLHNLTGGAWGALVRPALRSSTAVLPLMAVLSLPVMLQPGQIYHWADRSHIEHDAVLVHKQSYLNVEFFQIRAAIYFGIWLILVAVVTWHSRQGSSRKAQRRLSLLSGQGLALHGLAVTFASVDWMMSLEPHWFSTIYGAMVFVSQGLGAFAFAIAVAASAARPVASLTAGMDAFHDLGKLLLAFVMLWAYLSFSQYFIIWNGNLPEEVVWYLRRTNGIWQWVAISLIFFHFIVPFALLLDREWKRNPNKLGAVAAWILGMHWVELVWLVEPAFDRFTVSSAAWLTAGLTLAIGGLWFGVFTLLVRRVSMPLHMLHSEAHHG